MHFIASIVNYVPWKCSMYLLLKPFCLRWRSRSLAKSIYQPNWTHNSENSDSGPLQNYTFLLWSSSFMPSPMLLKPNNLVHELCLLGYNYKTKFGLIWLWTKIVFPVKVPAAVRANKTKLAKKRTIPQHEQLGILKRLWETKQLVPNEIAFSPQWIKANGKHMLCLVMWPHHKLGRGVCLFTFVFFQRPSNSLLL